jgi:hypothetical protein
VILGFPAPARGVGFERLRFGSGNVGGEGGGGVRVCITIFKFDCMMCHRIIA